MPPSVAILGGGIAGLSTAWHLQKLLPAKIPITLFEQSSHFGGWMESELVTRDGRRVLFEGGPRTLRIVGEPGKAMLELVHSLGLASSLKSVPKTSPAARNRYIYRGGQIHLLNPTPFNLLFSRSPVYAGILRGGVREAFVRRNSADDESVWNFFARRFDPRMADTLASAICHGVFAGNSKEMSMRSSFGSMWAAEQRSGSLVRDTMKGVITRSEDQAQLSNRWSSHETASFQKRLQQEASVVCFDQGMGRFPAAIVQDLRKASNVSLLGNQEVTKLELQEGPFSTIIHTKGNQPSSFSHVVSALPSTQLSRLLPTLANLSHIPYTTVAVVNLAFPSNVLPIRGFGYLVPGPELDATGGVLGCIFDSESHGDLEITRCTIMAGGWAFSKYFGDPTTADHDAILETALRAMRDQLGVTVQPLSSRILIQRDCIPQLLVGHHKKVSDVQDKLQEFQGHVQAIGAWITGVSVNDGVLAGRTAAEQVARSMNIEL
ncbi:protoporphyrinogen oxidase-like protein [Gonapodya prolifera JEL478]|uniref:Protoporphyrinogen oxidase n=1 Tax=Gonapodya prolifera (strain JEL478) TaxID=1344416 RepID=A0A139AE04_GONPJ|nr:protoporphyrinogen oxidase-like protein [Gonapodya prolifera JEL478]|eukprot:KXS15056.1 protoporphyrinogen oxidase-like protein [Gonapodya prolifera JEL478]